MPLYYKPYYKYAIIIITFPQNSIHSFYERPFFGLPFQNPYGEGVDLVLEAAMHLQAGHAGFLDVGLGFRGLGV